MKDTLKYTLFLFAVLIYMGGHAQNQRKNNVKLGLLRTTQAATPIHLSFERSIGRLVSLQPNLGFGVRRSYIFTTGNPAQRYVFHLGIEGRVYPLLRRNLLMSGFYLGPFVSYDRQLFVDPLYPFPMIKQYWSSVGLSIGYQHSFWEDRIRVDGGLKGGYREDVERKVFDTNGSLLYYTPLGLQNSYYFHLQVGYTF